MTTYTLDVGSGQPYSTIAAAVASLSGVTSSDTVIIYLHGLISLSGTDTCNGIVAAQVIITGAAGQTLQDVTGNLTTRLDPNAFTGVAGLAGPYGSVILTSNSANLILRGIRVRGNGLGSYTSISLAGANSAVDGCILDRPDSSMLINCDAGNTVTVTRSLLITSGNTANPVVASSSGSHVVLDNCTLAHIGTSGTRAALAVDGGSSYITANNCAIFGYSTLSSGGATVTGDHLATDFSTASGFTNAMTSQLASSCFKSFTNDANTDLSAPSGSPLMGAGATISAVTADIVGQAISAPYPIGASLYVSGGITASGALPYLTLTPPTGSASTISNATASGSLPSMTLTAPTGSASASGGGTITTPPLRNNTGTLLASISGWSLNVWDTSGNHIVTIAGLSTDSSGVLTATNVSLTSSTSYLYEPVHATYGRRLTTATAG